MNEPKKPETGAPKSRAAPRGLMGMLKRLLPFLQNADETDAHEDAHRSELSPRRKRRRRRILHRIARLRRSGRLQRGAPIPASLLRITPPLAVLRGGSAAVADETDMDDTADELEEGEAEVVVGESQPEGEIVSGEAEHVPDTKEEAQKPVAQEKLEDILKEPLFVPIPRQVSKGPGVALEGRSQKHGVWREGEDAPAPAAPVIRAPKTASRGLFALIGSLFAPRPRSAKPPVSPVPVAPVLERAIAPVMPEEVIVPDAIKEVKEGPADLDALLSGGESAPKKEVARLESVAKPEEAHEEEHASAPSERALPREDLLHPVDTPVQKKPVPEAPKTTTPVPAPAPAKPAVKKPEPEIVYKKMPKRRVSAFQEFLGAIKYFGLGAQRQAIVQNLATMLNAGLPLIDSLHTLQLETKIGPIKKLIQRIVDAVENGSPLWRAMDDMHYFSPHAIALIRIGEEAGNLAENMEYLAIQQEKDQALKAKVKMAMIYPGIVMTLMFIIVIGLGMFVLPNLISVLFSLNVPLPLVTRLVIAFTNLFTEYGAVAVPGSIGGFILLIILAKFTPLKVVAQWMIFKIPGIGRLVREATIARFGVILGGLLQAGVPLIDSLKSLVEVTPVVSYKNFYAKMLEHISLGDSFAKTFQVIRGSDKLLPISVQQLVLTGEKSGSLAKILMKVADIYEKKANDTAQKLPVILEPMLLLFIGGLVGTIAFAIIVPIYSIVGNIGGQ